MERANATPLSGSRDELTSSQRSPSESRLLPNDLDALTVSQVIGLFGRSVPRIDVYGSAGADLDEHNRLHTRFVSNRGQLLSDEPHPLAVSPPVREVLSRLATTAPDPPLGSAKNGVCALDQTP